MDSKRVEGKRIRLIEKFDAISVRIIAQATIICIVDFYNGLKKEEEREDGG